MKLNKKILLKYLGYYEINFTLTENNLCRKLRTLLRRSITYSKIYR